MGVVDEGEFKKGAWVNKAKVERDVNMQINRFCCRLNNPKLATLAYRVKLDAFTRVKKAIDDMLAP